MAELKAELERQGAAAATEHAKQQQQAAAALASAELQAATVRSKLDARAASLDFPPHRHTLTYTYPTLAYTFF